MWAVAIAGWAFPGLGGAVLGWWSNAQIALPFAVGFGVIVAAVLRWAWINEQTRLGSAVASDDIKKQALSPPHHSIAFDPRVLEHLAALDVRIGEVDDALRSAHHRNAEAMREESAVRFESVRKTAEQALNEGRQTQDALGTQLKAVAEAAKNNTRAVFDVLRDTYEPKFDEIAARQDEIEVSFLSSENRIYELLRARDDENKLRSLDAAAAELFRNLFYADERKYSKLVAWQADYIRWKRNVVCFWDILRRHNNSVGQPFQFTDTDLDGRNGIPDNGLFVTNEMRSTYQIMLVVNERHMNLKDNAFPFMADKGKVPPAPNPAEFPSPPSPP